MHIHCLQCSAAAAAAAACGGLFWSRLSIAMIVSVVDMQASLLSLAARLCGHCGLDPSTTGAIMGRSDDVDVGGLGSCVYT